MALLRTAYAREKNRLAEGCEPGQARFITPRAQDFIDDTEALRKAIAGRAWIGVAPHSISRGSLDYLHEVVEYARANELPLHMHVAEQPPRLKDSIGNMARARWSCSRKKESSMSASPPSCHHITGERGPNAG